MLCTLNLKKISNQELIYIIIVIKMSSPYCLIVAIRNGAETVRFYLGNRQRVGNAAECMVYKLLFIVGLDIF